MNVKQLNYSDLQILKKIGDSDNEIPYRQLYKDVYPDVEIIISSNGGNQADAKDIFQEVLLNLRENVMLGKYKEVGTLKAYLKRMVRNRWYNMKRGKKPIFVEDKDAYHVEDEVIASEGERSEKETGVFDEHKSLQECMLALKAKPRKLLELYFFENKKYKEIAELLDYKVASVKVIAKKTRDKLKDCLEAKRKLNLR